MDYKGEFLEIRGADQLMKALEPNMPKAVLPGAREAAIRGMSKAGMKIVGDAQRNLRRGNPEGDPQWVTGMLASSGNTYRSGEDEISAGFFDKTSKTGYATFVENGRRPGKRPPYDVIRAWVYKKLRITDPKRLNTVTFFMRRKIALFGTRAHPFFGPSLRENEPKIMSYVTEEVQKWADEYKVENV